MSQPAGSGGTPPLPGAYRIDPVHSFAQFSVKHLVVGRVDGRFNALNGGFVVTDDPERAFEGIDVTIESASIDTNHEARDEDLRGPRFFDTTRFPALRFRGAESERPDEERRIVSGELQIRDAAVQIAFDVVVRGITIDQFDRTKLGVSATAALSRRDFGLTAEIELESGTQDGPDVWLRLDIEAILEDR